MIKYGLLMLPMVLADQIEESRSKLNDLIAEQSKDSYAQYSKKTGNDIYKYRHFNDSSNIDFGYDSDPSWWDRIKYDLRDEQREIEHEIQEDMPHYKTDWKEENMSIWDEIMYWRFIINMFLCAVPYTFYLIFALAVNLFLNIESNKLWAEGNVYLMVNTGYLVIQSMLSGVLVYEIPFLLRLMKELRVLSFLSACVYNLIYSIFLAIWIHQVFYTEDESVFDSSSLIVSLLIAYNLVLHFPIIPINFMIIFKEIEIEKFQLLHDDAGSDSDTVSLGYRDEERTWTDFLWFIDPFTYSDFITANLFHFKAKDLWEMVFPTKYDQAKIDAMKAYENS